MTPAERARLLIDKQPAEMRAVIRSYAVIERMARCVIYVRLGRHSCRASDLFRVMRDAPG